MEDQEGQPSDRSHISGHNHGASYEVIKILIYFWIWRSVKSLPIHDHAGLIVCMCCRELLCSRWEKAELPCAAPGGALRIDICIYFLRNPVLAPVIAVRWTGPGFGLCKVSTSDPLWSTEAPAEFGGELPTDPKDSGDIPGFDRYWLGESTNQLYRCCIIYLLSGINHQVWWDGHL